MKKLLSFLLALVMTAALAAPAARADEGYVPRHYTEAMVLNQLGLLQGVGTNPDGTPDFDLEKPATRLQALIMLIRLLGREEEARACTAPNPFSDIDGSSTGGRYAIYAHDISLAMGKGPGRFGNSPATPAQVVTFVLRALRYRDGEGKDFRVSTAMDFAQEIHLLDQPITGDTLRRDDVVHICYSALKTKVKNIYKPLAVKLIQDGVLTEEQVQNSGVLGGTVEVPLHSSSRLLISDVCAAFPEAASVTVRTLSSPSIRKTLGETDCSPLAVLLGTEGMESCWSGQGQLPRLKLDKDGSLRLKKGTRSASVVSVLDKHHRLIGYAVAARGTRGNLLFHTCQVDGAAAMEALKARCAAAVEELPEIDAASLGIVDRTVSSGGNTYPQAELTVAGPLSNFAWYSVSEKAEPAAAWAEAHDPLTIHTPAVRLRAKGQADDGLLAGRRGAVTVLLYDTHGAAVGWGRLDLAQPG